MAFEVNIHPNLDINDAVEYAKSGGLRKRRKAFCDQIDAIQATPKYKKAFAGIDVDTAQTIDATPSRLQLLFGKKGFMKAAERLGDGRFSIIGEIGCTEYMSLKIHNVSKYLGTHTVQDKVKIEDSLKSINKLFGELRPEVQGKLDTSLGNLLDSWEECKGKVALACGGGAAAIGGATFALGIGAGSVLCVFSGGALLGIGAVVFCAGALGTAIMRLVRRIKNNRKCQKDLMILELIQAQLRVITKLLESLDKDFDKFGSATGELVAFLKKIQSLLLKYLKKVKRRIEYLKKKSVLTLRNEVDLAKAWIAELGCKLTVDDLHDFKVPKDQRQY